VWYRKDYFSKSIVDAKGIKMDEAKFKVIKKWPTPKIVSKVISFHRLTSFIKGL